MPTNPALWLAQAIAREHGGRLNRAQATEVLQGHGPASASGAELCDVLWTEMGLSADAAITKVIPDTNGYFTWLLRTLTWCGEYP